jgi:hypothetical protein
MSVTMTLDEIRGYVIGYGLLNNPIISLLGRGESNINYLADDDGQKLVIRIARPDVPEYFRFEAEHHFMLFVEALGIKFAPRSVHYDPVRNIHIVSYVDGRDASVIDLNAKQTNIFVSQLKRLNAVTYDEYLDWCKKTGQSPRNPVALESRNKMYLKDKLQAIREHIVTSHFASQVIEWAVPKIEVLKMSENGVEPRTVFLHNDLRWSEGGGNIKIVHDKVFFIDWELSGFFGNAVPEVGDVLGSIPHINENILKRLYATYVSNEPNLEQLNKAIKYGVLWGRLGNTVWAAERYLFLTKANHPEAERYKHLAEIGMRDAEPFFDLPFEQWF